MAKISLTHSRMNDKLIYNYLITCNDMEATPWELS